jgi:hypothetical protein
MLGRPDPFFATRTPQRNGYLESLHRTYGEPVGALPQRNDELFARAYAFRQREKADQEAIQKAHQELQGRYDGLVSETKNIEALIEELSKSKPTDDDLRAGPDPGEGVHKSLPVGKPDARRSDEAVAQHPAPGARARDRDGDLPVAEPRKDAREGGAGVVPEQVLHERGVDRHTDGDAADGPEPAGGAREAVRSADAGGGGPEDQD